MDAAAPARCLETNVYAKPTSGGVKKLGPEEFHFEPLRYLLDSIKPNLIIGHGRTARRHLEQQNLNCEVKYVSHFSSPIWFEIFSDGYTA